ncbi:zinc-binding dehydrogenase [Streptomyces arenae]|uniref:zinc-binding dehydrogenase n=1 Tax=Streptomyces arenae TaxID=29301 RepID=UPI00265B18D2|nr:zinc-binding dehydrogenase [Streptomyces arenae]MCG7204775.1 zinc-binding dehydrogenase [Streptomyces arenae]
MTPTRAVAGGQRRSRWRPLTRSGSAPGLPNPAPGRLDHQVEILEVLVTGASGAVGAVAVQLAARAGAEVVGAVGRPAKLPHVPGVAKALLASDLSEEAIGGKADVLIDTVGGQILRNALTLVRPRGRAALLGYTAGRELTLDLADFSLLPVNMINRSAEVAPRCCACCRNCPRAR